MNSLIIHPPFILAKWIPTEERPKYIYKIELYGNITGNVWSADIDLILAYRAIKSKLSILSAKTSYKIGCKEIALSIYGDDGCTLKSFTQSKVIPAKYTQSLQVNKDGSFTISPAIPTKAGSLQPFNYQSGQGKQFTHTVTFDCEERVLAERHELNGIEWTLKKPPHQNLLRDFMYGNLLLNATFEWLQSMSGVISIEPIDIGIFNTKNEYIGKRASLITEFYLYCRGYRVANRRGVSFKFEIK